MIQFIRFSIFLIIAAAWFSPAALATRLPADFKALLLSRYSDGRLRPDGALETKKGELFLPLVPVKAADKSIKVQLVEKCPAVEPADVLAYSNGWCYVRVVKRGTGRTILIPNTVSDKMRKQIMSCKFPDDLFVPDGMFLAKSLKSLIGDTAISVVEDPVHVAVNDPHAKALTPGPKPVIAAAKVVGVAPKIGLFAAKLPEPAKHSDSSTAGSFLLVTSPGTGIIMMLDGITLKKLIEFPTEGTPEGMAVANGKLYIADQAKSRILILDPRKKEFLAQIDLPTRSAPKGLAAMPDGRLLYASESASGCIDVIETMTRKVLLRTKVNAGPGRIALCPNGTTLVVLNVPSGVITLLSTSNQKVLGVVPVGHMPNAIVFTKDSSTVYVSNRVSNSVVAVDLAKKVVVGTFKTGAGPTGLALSNDEKKLFVASAKENLIQVFDTLKREKLQEVKMPLDLDFPGTLMMTPDGAHIIVSSASTDAVGLFDVSKMEFERQPVIGHTSDDMLWLNLD